MKLFVRNATTEDMAWLLGQLRAFSEFFGTRIPLFGSEEFTQDALLNMMANHLLLVADSEETGPVGLIGGYLTPHSFNPGIIVLAETFWWVAPEYRGTRAGLMLLNAFTDFGKENADWITFSLEEKSPVNPDCLAKRGYRSLERNFLMEVQ